MKKQETTIYLLNKFIPKGAFDLVAPFFQNHTIHLTLTHERKSVLGDYRHPIKDQPYHRISVNVNLNPYSFLITLLHEIAHLQVWVHFKNNVSPHGKEWKTQFRHIMIPFIGKGFFPKDVEQALFAYLHNPAASTCTDVGLFKALYRYDEQKPGHKLIDDMEPGHWFEIEDGRVFEIIEHNRTRSRCRELENGKVYFFSSISEVKQLRRDKRRIA
ncbi:MAG TPA: SprT-like domain-containing protein [Flavipsychrobacter sp.]|nr:SprT-like domain-containing protein [Flavipsychrobacter sp.]